MTELIGSHNGLHSEQGARPGEHPGRSANPVIKVHDVAWLEFEKPDLKKAEAFALAFGFSVALRTDDELHLRGSDAGAPCVLIRRGPRSRFIGPAFVAAEHSDLLRLADATGATVRPLPETLGGVTVDLVDPSGIRLRVVSGLHQLEELPSQKPHVFNFGASHDVVRANVHPAAPPGAHPGAAARAHRAADHQVHRSAELVPGPPGADRQRLLLLPRPA